jgi:hypothetical protein
MSEIFYHKASEMALLDYFAIHAPAPSESEIQHQRMQDTNRKRNNEKYIMRSDTQIECELRYRFAKEMVKVR